MYPYRPCRNAEYEGSRRCAVLARFFGSQCRGIYSFLFLIKPEHSCWIICRSVTAPYQKVIGEASSRRLPPVITVIIYPRCFDIVSKRQNSLTITQVFEALIVIGWKDVMYVLPSRFMKIRYGSMQSVEVGPWKRVGTHEVKSVY